MHSDIERDTAATGNWPLITAGDFYDLANGAQIIFT